MNQEELQILNDALAKIQEVRDRLIQNELPWLRGATVTINRGTVFSLRNLPTSPFSADTVIWGDDNTSNMLNIVYRRATPEIVTSDLSLLIKFIREYDLSLNVSKDDLTFAELLVERAI